MGVKLPPYHPNQVGVKKTMKTKIKPCVDEATDFHDKEIPKVRPHYACLVLI